jgi:hypothetical protein
MKRTNKQNDRKNEQKKTKKKKPGFSTRMNKKKHTVYTKKEMADLFLAYGLKEDTGNFLVA